MYYPVLKKGVKTGERTSAFNCSEFLSHGKHNCNSKAIKERILNELVLRDIRGKAQQIEIDEDSAREEFYKRKSQQLNNQTNVDSKRLKVAEKRQAELSQLIQSVYEDKVLKRIPEEVCVELLRKYQEEKATLETEIAVLKAKAETASQATADVDEFIRRIKQYASLTELDRTTAMDLIEYITVGRVPKNKATPREIHIHYKFLDQPKTK